MKFGPPTPKKMRTVSPALARSGCCLGERADRAVKDEIFRPLRDQLFVVHLLVALCAEGLSGIDLALHDIELTIDLRQAAFGLHQDHAVHAVGDVLRHARRRAVIDKKTGHERLEGHNLLRARIGLGKFGAAARAHGRVKIDRMDHDAVVIVLEVHFDRVADAHAQHRARHFAVESPVIVGRLVGQLALKLRPCVRSTRTICGASSADRREAGRLGHGETSAAVATAARTCGPGAT